MAENCLNGQIKYVFFDLDGTLTDPGIGITNSIMYALSKMNINPPPRAELYPFIGPPLRESFEKYYGMNEEQSRMALMYYREYFSVKGLFENSVYQGIPELLGELCGRSVKVVLATSKPLPFSEKILRHFGLYKYFTFVSGSTMDGNRVNKAEVIRYAVEALGVLPLEAGPEIIMVGDRRHDVEGAHENGIRCAGVLYGYGDEDEMRECGADFIIEGVKDLRDFLVKATDGDETV